MQKRRFSIRYKILALLTLVPVFTLGAFLLMALKIFKDDKMAYVFDSTSNLSGTLASQIKNQLNTIIIGAKPLFQDYAEQGKFSEISDSLLKNSPNLDFMTVYELDETVNKLTMKSYLEKSPQMVDELTPKIELFMAQARELTKKQQRLIFSFNKDDRLFIIERVDNTKQQKFIYFGFLVQLSELEQMFKTVGAQKIFLIDSLGRVIFGPQEFIGETLSQKMDLNFLKQAEMISQGVEVSKDRVNGDSLISYSKVGFGDLYVMTSVIKEKALGALGTLLRKSVIFFVLLISLTVMISLLASNTMTQSLTSLFDATKKVSEGKFNFQVDVKSNDEVGSLAENFNLMAAEVSRLLSRTAENARMENELRTAKTVQETLFPEPLAQLGPLQISGFYEPASECGGDWWHYSQLGDKILLWIGDATGHGAPSALITAAAKSAASIIEWLNVGPAQAMELLNGSIYECSRGQLMMTFFLASYDTTTGEVTYANASHEAPFLIRKSNEPLKRKDLIPLNEVNNPRLGQSRSTTYVESKIKLEPGDLMLFYTDGIPDIRNPKGESWGEREFVKAIINANQDFPTATDSMLRISTAFQKFRQGSSLVDDVTFFIVKNNNEI